MSETKTIDTQKEPEAEQKYDIPPGIIVDGKLSDYFPLEPYEFEEKDFTDLAQLLLSHAYIQVKSSVGTSTKYYRIIELEFYLKNDKFQDNYTHCDPDQKQFAHWYFHRSKPGGSYKGGTFKGLDLTLGYKGGYFGVLIRSISKYFDAFVHSVSAGPCIVVNQLLKDTGFSSIGDLVRASESMDVRKNKFINLVFSRTIPQFGLRNIYTSPRIGLGDSYPELQNRNFRFTAETKGMGIKKCTSLKEHRTFRSEEYKKFREKVEKNQKLFD